MKSYRFCLMHLFLLFVCAALAAQPLLAQEGQGLETLLQESVPEEQLAGEFFDIPVPMGNYYFAKKVVAVFSAPWRGTPQTAEELEDLTWQELLLSYEAFRRNITVSDEELASEISKTLEGDKVTFKWNEDKDAYAAWVDEKLKEPIEAFENQMRHLVQLRKLREAVIEETQAEVTDEEAYQKFLDEYNSLSVELVEFEEKTAADAFFKSATGPVPDSALDGLIWQDCVMSVEAEARSLVLTDEEEKAAITKFLREENAHFVWEKNTEAFAAWTKEKFQLDHEIFKKYIVYFARLDSLRQKIASGEQPAVDQARCQEFRAKDRSVASAYAQFCKAHPGLQAPAWPTLKDARKLYKQMKRSAGFWEDAKRGDPKKFKRPGFVALDFLINIWGFKRPDAYAMLDEEIGSYYQPSPIYKGYGVFKIVDVRKADPKVFDEKKQYYFDRVKMIKKYQGFTDWLKALKEKADIQVFVAK